jgi:hypothetical protein
MDNPLLLTYDNAPTENTKFFIETLKQNKWNYKLIGEGELWEGFVKTRVSAYLRELSSLPDNQLVILTDARDVICLRPPNYFKDGFQSFGEKLVVSMELFCEGNMDEDKVSQKFQCIPLTQYWNYYNPSRPNRKFANMGLLVGRVKDLRHCLSWIKENNYKDDQLGLCNYMNTFPERVSADVHAEMLHTSGLGINCGTINLKIQNTDSPTIGELLGTGAFFLHIPGHNISKGQKFMYDTVVQMLKDLKGKKLTDAYGYSPLKWNETL